MIYGAEWRWMERLVVWCGVVRPSPPSSQRRSLVCVVHTFVEWTRVTGAWTPSATRPLMPPRPPPTPWCRAPPPVIHWALEPLQVTCVSYRLGTVTAFLRQLSHQVLHIAPLSHVAVILRLRRSEVARQLRMRSLLSMRLGF